MDRGDLDTVRRVVRDHMKRLNCPHLETRRWEVPRVRAEKALRTRLGAGALIWNRKVQVLLVRHHPDTGWPSGKWFTPGGVVEEGEVPEEAVVREIEEEVGISVRVLSLPRVNREILVHGDLEAESYFFQFEVLHTDGTPEPGEGEILEVRWFDGLPGDMAFREDYIEMYEERRADPSPLKRVGV